MTTKIVEVHHFKAWDSSAGDYVIPPTNGGPLSKRTAADIERLGCEIIPGTAEMVDVEALDEHGRYRPTMIG